MKTKEFQRLLREIVRETLNILQESRGGEWWIQGGTAVFADGTVGDSGHEGYVIDHLSREIYEHFVGSAPDEMGYLGDYEDDLFRALQHDDRLSEKDIAVWNNEGGRGGGPAVVLVEKLLEDGVYKTPAQANFAVFGAYGQTSLDVRDYGMQYLGWKRLDQNGKYLAVQTWFLQQSDLNDIKRGIWDALSGEEPEEEEDEEGNEHVPDYEVEIEVRANNRHFDDIPLSELEKASVQNLIPYLKRSFQMREGDYASYVNIGHGDPADFLWLWKDGVFKTIRADKGGGGHASWVRNNPELRNADFEGRFEVKTKRLSIVDMASFRVRTTHTDLSRVPKELLQRLKFEFGDDIKISTFFEESDARTQAR